MDMEFSPEDLAFQKEVRDFIAENYPAELRGKQDEGDELTKEDFLAWHKILYKKGWVAPAWPVEYGGTGWTPTQRFIFSEETARADCIERIPARAASNAPSAKSTTTRMTPVLTLINFEIIHPFMQATVN